MNSLGLIGKLLPLAQGWGGYGPGMMGGWGSGYGMWFFPLIMMVFWIAVIVGIIFLIRWAIISSRGPQAPREDEAMEILKRRFASGEISKEEFEERKKVLRS
jgi:putative membrane protein